MQDMQGDQTPVEAGAVEAGAVETAAAETGAQDATEPAESDHAAIIRLLNSETWTRRLEEARQSRKKILAQKQRPVSAPVFRPAAAQRVSRQDRLPPLEPAVPVVARMEEPRAERGVVVQFQPPGAVFRPAPEEVEPISLALEETTRDITRLGQIAVAFIAGIGLGVVLSILF